SVKKVTDIIAEISSSSQEQASGIDEVNKAILRMDENTQQNAALVEEAAAASITMNQEADELTKQMDFFKLSDKDMVTNHLKSSNSADRRGASRPWQQKTTEEVNESIVDAKKVSGSDIEDQQWQEF
ncbi:MAG: methyl-accepting chemotaxis protein, partial [Gammaproteobacteria bacterium]